VIRRLRIVAIALCASSVYANSAFEPKTKGLQTFELEQKLAGSIAATAREWILVENGRPDPVGPLVAALGLSASMGVAAADNFALGICRAARQNFHAEIDPISSATSYFLEHQKPLFKDKLFEGEKVSLLTRPKPGTRTYSDDGSELAKKNSWFNYLPKPGFGGTDRFVMQIEKAGVKLRIYDVIKAIDDVEADAGYCPIADWKISQYGESDPSATDYDAWQRNANLSALIAGAQQTLTGFIDLPATALGQTNGEGASANITVDGEAAGNHR